MKKTRFLSLLLAVILTISIIGGCGDGTATRSTLRLVFHCGYGFRIGFRGSILGKRSRHTGPSHHHHLLSARHEQHQGRI